MKHITVNLLDYFWKTGIKPIKEKIDHLHKVASTGKYTDLTETPTALKNPCTLNFTGGVTEYYDGSVDKSVRIPSLTNNLLANVPGTALDAVQGKALADELSQINSNIGSRLQRIVVSGITNTGGGIPLPLYGQEMVIVSMSEISTVNRIALPVNTGVGQIYAVILGNGIQPLVDVDATVEIIYYPR